MKEKINVIIDARMVDEKLHGIARYTYELIVNSIKLDKLNYTLLVNDMEIAKKLFGSFNDIDFILMKNKFLSIGEQIELPKILNRYRGKAIFHSPSFVASPFIKTDMVMTIHDLNHVRLPQFYSPFHKYYYKYIVRTSAKKSKCILTVSEFSKKEILSWVDLEPSDVVVTYNGIGDKFRIIEEEDVLSRVRLKYKLPEKFVLYVGNLKPHKNVETLVKAVKYIKSDETLKLIIGGSPNEGLTKLIKDNNLFDRVQFIGFIDEKDLSVIYNLALMFVFPSLYEGFGLPPLEAMACGCPAIVANTSSLPEVLGEEGLTFKSEDEQDLANKIDYLLGDEDRYNKYVSYGIERAKYFNWDKLVNETVFEYEKIWMDIKS
ncbi:glycosyltransferase family 1 protein [Clostridium sp. C8-1-8]|uniref:glycosyltransferase family 4 protein n=1 Tax=Clostridium sp. C8-1-8 TaxID=2698831 RepID=UPI00136D12B0|nr:glycosyltransferase family 1 protein [Clostridium sp. C8-1-8]